jgi:hypothetical protein
LPHLSDVLLLLLLLLGTEENKPPTEAFERVLGFLAHRLLGRPLWALMHPEDHPALKQAMTAVILAPGREAVSAPLSCRLACATAGKYVSVKAKMRRGTQGVVCSFEEEAQ